MSLDILISSCPTVSLVCLSIDDNPIGVNNYYVCWFKITIIYNFKTAIILLLQSPS